MIKIRGHQYMPPSRHHTNITHSDTIRHRWQQHHHIFFGRFLSTTTAHTDETTTMRLRTLQSFQHDDSRIRPVEIPCWEIVVECGIGGVEEVDWRGRCGGLGWDGRKGRCGGSWNLGANDNGTCGGSWNLGATTQPDAEENGIRG